MWAVECANGLVDAAIEANLSFIPQGPKPQPWAFSGVMAYLGQSDFRPELFEYEARASL